jgi:hypothetical protein
MNPLAVFYTPDDLKQFKLISSKNTMNKNQYVLTTRFVIYDNSEIIRITHEENGDWQFLGCEDNLKESDAVVVSLGEMMDFDNSLSVVDSLPVGKQALRTNKQSPWYIYDIEE